MEGQQELTKIAWDDSIYVFVLAFSIAGFCGLAWLLRSELKMSVRNIANSFLNSGLLGLIIALIWFRTYAQDVYLLLGLCGLAGLGGVKLVQTTTAVANHVLVVWIGKKLGIDFSKEEIADVLKEAKDENKPPVEPKP